MEREEAIRKLSELIKHKNDYDEAYGTKIYRPYSMSKEDWECVEVLLAELDKQIQVRPNLLIAGFQEGYNQGYLAGAMESI